MTKKDYIMIANAIKAARYSPGASKIKPFVFGVLLDLVIDNICFVLEQDNAKFDAIKFRQACK